MSEIFVSVIIPTYNRAASIERAVRSVLEQAYKHFELIVIDDGSTDRTKEILEQFSTIKYIYCKNGGVSKARNIGIEMAQGDWIAFLDSDDEWLPHKLEKQIAVIKEKEDTVCVHSDEIWVRNGVRVNQMKKHKKGGGEQFIPSLALCLISPSTVILKKEIFKKIGPFREDFPVCEDYDLWLKLTSLYSVEYVDEVLIKKYGGHEDQLSRKLKAMDFYRIKAIDWILEHRNLSELYQKEATSVLVKKAEILIKGYKKHNNLSDLPQVQTILAKYENITP